MQNFEIMFIVKPVGYNFVNPIETNVDKAIEDIRCTIVKNKGTMDKCDKWGMKRMVYDIGGYNQGYYALIYCSGDEVMCKKIDELLKSHENILRYMIIRKGE